MQAVAGVTWQRALGPPGLFNRTYWRTRLGVQEKLRTQARSSACPRRMKDSAPGQFQSSKARPKTIYTRLKSNL